MNNNNKIYESINPNATSKSRFLSEQDKKDVEKYCERLGTSNKKEKHGILTLSKHKKSCQVSNQPQIIFICSDYSSY